VRFSTLLYLYGRRLRSSLVQELLAGLGIAVGVALVFAVQVANSSITTGSEQIEKSLIGSATLQLRARSDMGFSERVAKQVYGLPGVRRAAPVLDLPGSVQADGRHLAVQIAGAELTLAALDGLMGRLPLEHLQPQVVMLPQATAEALGVSTTLGPGVARPLPTVTLRVRGRSMRVRVAAVLGRETVGPLANAMTVIAPLELLQSIAGLRGRVTRMLVDPLPGQKRRVAAELRRVAAGRLTVGPANEDIALLDQASTPNAQATAFFAFVSAVVGLLLAFNAMLLSAPERRRMIADLRIQGARPISLVNLMLFQALCLGLVASAVGVLAGDLLASSVFHQTPGYLASAFMLGDQTVIGWQPVVFSMIGGVAATCLAAASPLLDLRRSRAIDAVHHEAGEPGQALSAKAQTRLFIASVAIVALTSGVLLVSPSHGLPATLGLAVATLLAIPYWFTLLVRMVQRATERSGRANILFLAARACRASTLRSLALAATGAIAVFGAVVANGAHSDLLKGLYGDYAGYVSTAKLWVTNKGDELATDSIAAPGLVARISRIPGVAEARTYQGSFLNLDGRRVWVIARSPRVRSMLPASQITAGNPAATMRRLHAGGWVTISKQLAEAAHTQRGGRLSLPTPSGPATYRVAAITGNLGWTSGAIVMSDIDYRRAWATSDPSAIEVSTRSGADVAAVQRALGAAIAGYAGLRVQSSSQRSAQADNLAREGLSRLSQISLLLIIAAALAMAAAMGASVWQRRASLASLRIQSFNLWQLRRLLLYESGLILAAGCLIGMLAGIYGHLLSDDILMLTTGFPAPFSLGISQMLQTLTIVILAALLVLLAPGYAAAQAPPTIALAE
jgi:putative ABC transport system permease protein